MTSGRSMPRPSRSVSSPSELVSRRVLVVDDHTTLRHAIRFVLEDAGMTVVEAPSGAEGLEAARRDLPDLILLDLHLPELTGTDVLRALREDPATHAIPVVVVTATGDEGREGAIELGAADYLTKPFSSSVLLLTVERALGGSGSRAASP